MRAFLLLFGLGGYLILGAQPTTAPLPKRPVQLFSLQTNILPGGFLRERQDYSVSERQGNVWSERYRLAAFGYERGFRKLDRRLRLRAEVAYYDYQLVDYRGGVFSDPIPFSEWEGTMVLVAPSLIAAPTMDIPIKPVLGLGALWSIPLEDQLIYTYSEVEQSNSGSPRLTVQRDGLQPGIGFFLQGGGRLQIGPHWQLGFHLRVMRLSNPNKYIDRKGAYEPASHRDSRALLSRSGHYWSQLELIYRI